MRPKFLAPFFLFAALTLHADGDQPADGYIPEPLDVIEKVPVADSVFIRHRGLPSAVDLSTHFPGPGSQGNQGSCVGWATTYALKTYHEKRKRNWDLGQPPQNGGPGEHIFSPAWTYNQINGGRDRGAHIPHALELLISKGAAPWSIMPYNVKDYRSQPSAEARRVAQQYRAKSFDQVPVQNVDAIKAEIARGNPLAIGVYTGPDRWACCRNGEVFDQFRQKRWMGHAMVLVGYDDRKVSPLGHRGAFKIMDSDGPRAATNGFAWVSYQFAPQFLYAAYVLRDWEPGGALPASPTTNEDILPPENIRASQGTQKDMVTVTWNRAAGATAYEIQRSVSGDFSFESVGFSGKTSFQDRNVQQDVAYDYRVMSIRDQKKSDPEQSLIAKGYAATQVQPAPPAPTPPPAVAAKPGRVENLAATNGTHRDKIVLTWDSVPNASKYGVVRFDAASRTWAVIGWAQSNRYEDAGGAVSGGQRLAYSVRAVNAKDEGPEAKPAWGAVNPNLDRAGQVPDVPQDVKADLRGASVVVSWKAVPRASEYYVFRRQYNSAQWDFVSGAKQTRFSENFPGAPGELWYYTVRAKFEAGGESADSAIAAVASAAERPVIRQRYSTDSELAAFAGNWGGEVASGEKKMQVVSLTVSPAGETYSLEIAVNGRKKTLKGRYIARSGELTPPGLSIKAVPANPGLISVTCRDRSFCGVPFRDTLYKTQ